MIRERAAAKVNLTLAVHGRRPDGFHEIESLVVFAGSDAASDTVTLAPGGPPEVLATGPFAPTIAGENLLAVALRYAAEAAPDLILGQVKLEKRLPTAAGVGGGSADAAALLRALMRANPQAATTLDWHAIAKRIGADVPVCLASSAQVMRGLGERLTPVAKLPPLDAVLVNPLAPVPADKTARVFKALAAQQLSSPPPERTPHAFTSRAELLDHVRSVGNDLTSPAITIVPEIGDVLRALARLQGCALAQMSGGGPTCFALFDNAAEASAAARTLASARPGWWVVATELR